MLTSVDSRYHGIIITKSSTSYLQGMLSLIALQDDVALYFCQDLCIGATSNLSGLTEMNEEAAFSHTLRNVGVNTAL